MSIQPPVDPLASDIEETLTASTKDGPVSYNLVHLAGVPVPVIPPIQFAELATLYPRLTVGDFTNASDNFFSIWIQNNWTGGGQVEEMRETAHVSRYWTGTAEARHVGILAQPPETVSLTWDQGNGDALPVADYGVTDERLYVAFGTKLARLDANDVLALIGTMAAPPVGKGVVYDGKLWIPLGAAGYAVYDETALTDVAEPTAIAFAVWDEKLVALTQDGRVLFWDGTAWVGSERLRLRGHEKPRHLIPWWSPEGLPTLYIVTDSDLWAVDVDVPIVMRTGLRFPRHPDHGLAAAVWRDDGLYVAVGMGVHHVTIGSPPSIAAIGLDRDSGVPASQRGAIVDFAPEYNGLFALVRGEQDPTEEVVGEGPAIEETMLYEEAPLIATEQVKAKSSLFVYTGFGWHMLWESSVEAATPTKVMVSQADGRYRVYWGHGKTLYRQEITRAYHNPAQAALARSRRFAQQSYLVTGQFDANLTAFFKIWSHVEVSLDRESKGMVDIWYRTDDDLNWRLLGTASGTGLRIFGFDPDGDGWPEGEASRWIQFRYDLASSNAQETPLVRWIALKFLVVPLQTRAWTMTVPLIATEQMMGVGPDALFAFLNELTVRRAIVPFRHRDRVYRVRVTRVVAGEQPGPNPRRVVTLTVAEAKLHGAEEG